MTYTEDRATFEQQLRQPPHFARLMDHAGKYVGRMTKIDKNAVLEMALNFLWENRERIHSSNDILRQWVQGLDTAVRTRKHWLIWYNLGGWRWEKSARVGKG